MHALHLNSDPGIPLLGSKGASLHTRAVLHGLAAHCARVTALSTCINPRSGPCADLASVPAHVLMPPEGAARLAPPDQNEQIAKLLTDAVEKCGVDFLYERLALHGIAGSQICRRFDLPHVVEVNSPLTDEAERYRSLPWPTTARALEESVLRGASAVIVVSEYLMEWAQSRGVDRSRVLILPNGCDLDLFSRPAERIERPADSPHTIAFVGSLKPWHGLDVLVDAFVQVHAQRPDTRLLIIGDGPERANLEEQLAESLLPPTYEFTGMLPHAEVAALLHDVDVAVAPYPDLPGFYFSPLKIAEYCAAGVPVVASAIGQIEELLGGASAAELVPPGDAPALARAILRLRDDETARARLVARGYEFARRYSWERVFDRMFEWLGAHDVIPAVAR